MKRQNVRSLLLVASMILYLLIGAAIFEALESTNEERERGKLERERVELMKKYNLTKDDWSVLSDHIIRFIPHKAGLQWKFAGAIYFSTTVITTIGYGHCTPKTNWGKIVCMVYALLGIPLNLVTFQSIGERLNTFTTYLLCSVKRRIKPRDTKSHDSHNKATAPSQREANQCSQSVLIPLEGYSKTGRFETYSNFQKDQKHPVAAYRNGMVRAAETNSNCNQLGHSLQNDKTNSNKTDDSRPVEPIFKSTEELRSHIKNVKIPPKIVGNTNDWSLNELLSSSFSSKVGEATDTHLICVTTSISTVFVAGGAYAYSRYEGWSYLDSLYFCIITLTTVGFGDLVALQKEKVLQDKPGYVTFNILFILSGLAVVSAAMNLLVLRFLTMNTEDEKRDKMLESFNAEAKATNSIVSRWSARPAPRSKRKKFLTLTDLFRKIKKRFNKARPPSPVPKTPRYRVTRAPTENVDHLIDVSPTTNVIPNETLQGLSNSSENATIDPHSPSSHCYLVQKPLVLLENIP